MEELITSNLFSAFIGSTIGVLFSFFLKKKNEREALTLEFHKEWNSYEMSNHRNIAYIFIKKIQNYIIQHFRNMTLRARFHYL